MSQYLQNYKKSHLNQLKLLFDKNHHDQLIIKNYVNQQEHCYYYPSLLKMKFYEEVREKLNRNNLKAHQFCWLIISKAMLKADFQIQKKLLQQKYGEKWIQILDKWLNLQEAEKIVEKPLQKVLVEYRQHFEYLNQKAIKYGYFNLTQVPVYLISTQWLQKFYDTTSDFIQPIDNRKLIKLLKFIDSDYKLVHLNYEIKTEQMKQNKDFKIISPQSWKFLYEKFSGVQIKRFTTNQNDASVQLAYRKLTVSIVENRYFYMTNLQILVPRFSSFKSILQRLKRLIIAYKILPFKKLNKKFQFIKVNKLKEDQLVEIVQDEQIEQIEADDDRFQKIDMQFDVEQAKIYSQNQQIILNIQSSNDIFSQVKKLKTIITRQKCLNCGSNTDIFLCICKAVHFCSDSCQRSHKQHAKECQRIRKEQMKLTRLLSDYQVTQRQIKLSQQQILQHGKVGLQNLRNTCYLNSALQCILRVDKLAQYFGNNDHVVDLNVDNVLGSQGHLACAFGQLIKNYYSTNKRALEPINVLRIIAKNPQFRGAEHQDSQQFLNYFLDKLHEDLNRIKKKPYTQQIQSNGRADEIVSNESWQNYLKRNQSFIQELFTGQYRSQIRCPDCQKISITFDPFMSVTLQFPKPEKYIQFKGYLLTESGQFQKVQLSIPASARTDVVLEKTFHQKVAAVNIERKIVKKQWRQNVLFTKNYVEDGVVLFYIKQEGWEKQFNLQFLDEKEDMIGFNRRIYIKSPKNIQELKSEIYSHLRIPLEKALKKSFDSQQSYLQYCYVNNLIKMFSPSEQSLNFPLIDSQFTLKLIFNSEATFQQKVKLNVCLTSYEVKEEFFIRDSRDTISVTELIENFKIPQRLTEDNMWYCNKCKDHKMADKMMRIYRLPEFLVIHLKRFNHKNTRFKNLIGVEKIDTAVKLKQVEIINGQSYELIGIVNHFGSMSFGHYTAYVKKDQWVTYDDQKVKRCNPNGDNAYLLFYKKKQNTIK